MYNPDATCIVNANARGLRAKRALFAKAARAT